VEYYSFADRLVRAVEDSSHSLAAEQFSIIENIVTQLEEYTDQITSQYIEYVKNGESEKVLELVRNAMNNITIKSEECRNKILMLYREGN
jgi:ATP-dependent protease HslVU (ClpYQ) peptidase subunit